MKSRMKRIALFLQLGHHYLRGCMHGVREAVTAEGATWIFHHLPPTVAGFARLRDWQPDGVLASAPDRTVGRLLESLAVPVVHLGNRHVAPRLPQVGPDHHAIGRLAADHLLERGLRTMAFIGWPGQPFSEARGLGFQERLAESGIPLRRHAGGRKPVPGQEDRPPSESAVAAWLRTLPTPVGLLAANDYLAWQVAEIARQEGLRIPEDIALLGADDDPMVGDLIHVSLSSVQVDARRIGQEAAAMLQHRLEGRDTPTVREITPTGVFARASTDLRCHDDPLIRQAVALIAADAGRHQTVATVAQHLGISRRTLERRFIHGLDRTVLAEIQRVRLDRAKTLLTTTATSIAGIAEECGFGSAAALTALFKTRIGCTPLRYRENLGR